MKTLILVVALIIFFVSARIETAFKSEVRKIMPDFIMSEDARKISYSLYIWDRRLSNGTKIQHIYACFLSSISVMVLSFFFYADHLYFPAILAAIGGLFLMSLSIFYRFTKLN